MNHKPPGDNDYLTVWEPVPPDFVTQSGLLEFQGQFQQNFGDGVTFFAAPGMTD